jgi:MerR family mercuric resistance operon transcriptional regulator
VARLGGVNLETIRYYERTGLLPRPPRTHSGYRLFPPETVRRVRFVKRAQALGFALSEIRELLALRRRRGASQGDILAHTQAKITAIDEKIRALAGMRAALLRLSERCDGCGPLEDCPILEAFDDRKGDMDDDAHD